jgi:hypothetical protein
MGRRVREKPVEGYVRSMSEIICPPQAESKTGPAVSKIRVGDKTMTTRKAGAHRRIKRLACTKLD